MLAIERRNEILTKLQEDKRVVVTSAATIIEAAENVSNTPNAFTFSTFAAP